MKAYLRCLVCISIFIHVSYAVDGIFAEDSDIMQVINCSLVDESSMNAQQSMHDFVQGIIELGIMTPFRCSLCLSLQSCISIAIRAKYCR